jgi:ribosome-associated toxin RatA of RatAB toxin-antitoxin module
MRTVHRSALVARPPARMFALINDIESYPQFVPWCTSARIESRSDAQIVATLGVRRGPLRTEFTTRNVLEPGHAIRMTLERGPFSALEGAWTLAPVGELGTRVELALRFAFKSSFAASVFEPLFEETAAALLDAFVLRARSLDQ